jgi:hypothetical protein
MQLGTEKDFHRAMSKHLWSGVLPGQFGMDALRIDELRRHPTCFADGRPTGSGNAPNPAFGNIFDKLVHALERLRDALLRESAIRRLGM